MAMERRWPPFAFSRANRQKGLEMLQLGVGRQQLFRGENLTSAFGLPNHF